MTIQRPKYLDMLTAGQGNGLKNSYRWQAVWQIVPLVRPIPQLFTPARCEEDHIIGISLDDRRSRALRILSLLDYIDTRLQKDGNAILFLMRYSLLMIL